MQITGIGAGGEKPAVTPFRQNSPEETGLQKQLEMKRQELKALSENEEMDPKQRLEKKKEIEAEIAELNSQLQQKRSERMQGKNPEKTDDVSGQAKKRDGFSAETERMESLLSADRSVKQARAQDASAEKLTGKARVLRTEAKLDGGRGIGGEKKLAEASALERRAEKIKNESAEKLGNVLKAEKTDKAAESERAEEKEKEDESSDVLYQKDGSLVEQAEEERELDERA